MQGETIDEFLLVGPDLYYLQSGLAFPAPPEPGFPGGSFVYTGVVGFYDRQQIKHSFQQQVEESGGFRRIRKGIVIVWTERHFGIGF